MLSALAPGVLGSNRVNLDAIGCKEGRFGAQNRMNLTTVLGDFGLAVDLCFGDHGISMRRKGEMIGKLRGQFLMRIFNGLR
jgi:hypothetical protein